MTTAIPEAAHSLRNVQPHPSDHQVWTIIVNAFDRWLRRRRAMRQLYLLDQQTMKDLGIHRSEVKSIVFADASERRRPYADN